MFLCKRQIIFYLRPSLRESEIWVSWSQNGDVVAASHWVVHCQCTRWQQQCPKISSPSWTSSPVGLTFQDQCFWIPPAHLGRLPASYEGLVSVSLFYINPPRGLPSSTFKRLAPTSRSSKCPHLWAEYLGSYAIWIGHSRLSTMCQLIFFFFWGKEQPSGFLPEGLYYHLTTVTRV